MPIIGINPDGTVKIARKSGADERNVKPEELGQYSPSLVKEYVDYLDAQKSLEAGGSTTSTAAEKKVKSTQSVLDNLSTLYYGKEGEKPLALAKEGELRLPAQLKGLEAKIVAGKANSIEKRIFEYNRLRQSKMAFLAKAYGDTGNIAYQEQLNAIQSLPDVGTTPGEALTLWDTAYSSTGAEPSKRLQGEFKKSNYQRQEDIAAGKTQTIDTIEPPSSSTDNPPKQGGSFLDMFNGGADLQKELIKSIFKGGSGAAEQSLGLLGQILKQTGAEEPLLNTFYPRASAEGKKLSQGEIPTPDEIIGGVGEGVIGLLPFSKLGKIPFAGLSALAGGVHGATTPGASSEERVSRATQEGVLGGLLGLGGSIINRGKNILTGSAKNQAAITRNKIAEETTKNLSTSKLKEEATRIADNLPATANKAQEEIAGLSKNINARDLVEKIDFWGQAFKASGDLKDTASGKLYGALQRTAKSLLQNEAPEIMKAHEVLQREAALKSGIPNFLKKTLYLGGSAAGLAGGGAYLYNLLKGGR